MKTKLCPNCNSSRFVKSGVINKRQRYTCKSCSYNFTVNKLGKRIDDYYVNKALQLYLEGLTYREIERILGVSHVSIINWVKKYNIRRPYNLNYHPTYRILNREELADHFSRDRDLAGSGTIVTEIGDKFMLIIWERFRD